VSVSVGTYGDEDKYRTMIAAVDAFISSTNHGLLKQEILNFTTPFPSQNINDGSFSILPKEGMKME